MQIFADGFFNEYKLDSLIFDADYFDGEIILQRGKILANESEILVTAEILKNINKTRFQFKNLNLTRLIPDAIETDLTGRLYLEMEKLDFRNITGILRETVRMEMSCASCSTVYITKIWHR